MIFLHKTSSLDFSDIWQDLMIVFTNKDWCLSRTILCSGEIGRFEDKCYISVVRAGTGVARGPEIHGLTHFLPSFTFQIHFSIIDA